MLVDMRFGTRKGKRTDGSRQLGLDPLSLQVEPDDVGRAFEPPFQGGDLVSCGWKRGGLAKGLE